MYSRNSQITCHTCFPQIDKSILKCVRNETVLQFIKKKLQKLIDKGESNDTRDTNYDSIQ